MSNVLVFVLELIGTAAFAVSGAIVGIKKQMDLFGVIVLGVCTAVGGGETVTGLSWGRGRTADDGAEALMVNFDCRHALVSHAEHFVAVYEADPSAANRADARYFVAMLKDSDCKERLLKRIK